MSRQIGKVRFEKNLRIGVRFDGAGFVLLNGQPFPKLAKDSVAELMVSSGSIVDDNIRATLTEERSIQMLGEGALVMIGVSANVIDYPSAEGLIPANSIPILSEYMFVMVQLDAPLQLRVRGDLEARLSECPCTIPTLKRCAESLNHAFTLISEAFETKRRSHSGNVFERGYAMIGQNRWGSLDELRLDMIAKLMTTDDSAESVGTEATSG